MRARRSLHNICSFQTHIALLILIAFVPAVSVSEGMGNCAAEPVEIVSGLSLDAEVSALLRRALCTSGRISILSISYRSDAEHVGIAVEVDCAEKEAQPCGIVMLMKKAGENWSSGRVYVVIEYAYVDQVARTNEEDLIRAVDAGSVVMPVFRKGWVSGINGYSYSKYAYMQMTRFGLSEDEVDRAIRNGTRSSRFEHGRFQSLDAEQGVLVIADDDRFIFAVLRLTRSDVSAYMSGYMSEKKSAPTDKP